MRKVILARMFQGHRTIRYPAGPPPALPDRFRGRPLFDTSRCPVGCHACADACTTGALDRERIGRIDLGRCIFCTDCATACPVSAISFSTDHRLSVRRREELVLEDENAELRQAEALAGKMKRLLGRSRKLRVVSAGGCNACEADVNVLTTIGWDLGRFGIQYVASPRHADGLLITGPVPKNMELALKKTYDAVPDPRIVIAVGTCAISGGPFIGLDEVTDGIPQTIPVDLFVPGCPPHPLTILDGLLRLVGKL